MKSYHIKIKAYKGQGYNIEREYAIKASAVHTAVGRAIKEFWQEKVNKKRKRHTTDLVIVAQRRKGM